jgi:hypothetical protein
MTPDSYISAPRVNALVLLLCAIALASPLVEAVPGNATEAFWLARGAGVTLALAAVVWPRLGRHALVGTAFFLVAVPCVLQVWMRQYTGPGTFCHDSVPQFEEATRMLRRGENPYAADFRGTTLEAWRGGEFRENPALDHFVYPPLLLLISVPFEGVFRAVGAYDQRVVVLLFFLAYFALLARRLRDHPNGVGLVALAALNPWFAAFVVEGRNDAAMLFWVAAAWPLYEGGCRRLGHLFLGLALATKTLLLPIVPFVVLAERKGRAWAATLLLAPIVLTSLPFLAADAPAFLEDVVGAPAGWGKNPFEMRGWGGFGFANLVLALHLAEKRGAFPFWIFQLGALVPVLARAVRGLREDGSFSNVLLWTAVAAFVMLFFGRFIHDNYIGAILALGALAAAARTHEPSRSGVS